MTKKWCVLLLTFLRGPALSPRLVVIVFASPGPALLALPCRSRSGCLVAGLAGGVNLVMNVVILRR